MDPACAKSEERQSAVPSSESQASSQKVAALSHVLRETYANAGHDAHFIIRHFFSRGGTMLRFN